MKERINNYANMPGLQKVQIKNIFSRYVIVLNIKIYAMWLLHYESIVVKDHPS